MRVQFKDSDAQRILDQIQEQLGGRKLGQILSFDLQDDTLVVTIKKLGTSTLTFDIDGKHWVLSQEKIALAHRAFRGEVMEKLTQVIENVGGQIAEV